VISPRTCPVPRLPSSCPGRLYLHQQARDAEDGTLTGGGAALQRIPVVRARVTVTDLVTGESMTVTEAAELDWCAALTTVRSSALTTTRRTTAVRDQLEDLEDLEDIHPIHHQTGVPGVPGPARVLELSVGNRSAGNSVAVSLTAGSVAGTLRRDTQTLNVFKLLRDRQTVL